MFFSLFLLSAACVLAQNPQIVAVSDPWQNSGGGGEFYFKDFVELSVNGVLEHKLQGRLFWNGAAADPSVPSPGPGAYIRITEDGTLGYGIDYIPYTVSTPVTISATVSSVEKRFTGTIDVVGGALFLWCPPTLPLEDTVMNYVAFNIQLVVVVIT